jgi:hypothetical protein
VIDIQPPIPPGHPRKEIMARIATALDGAGDMEQDGNGVT